MSGKVRVRCILLLLLMSSVSGAFARRIIPLTFEKTIEIAMANSYRVKQLQMGIERTRAYLEAEQAGLKSKVYMTLQSPSINAVSEYKWNSLLRKDEIVRQNTRLWQMELSVKQPVVLFGYPTDGYLSLNYKTYRYLQKDGYTDINYYNRYFLKFEQPFFTPNQLKNAIDRAKLKLQREELQFIQDKIELVGNYAEDYYDLYEKAFRNDVYQHHLENLNRILPIVQELAAQDTSRKIEAIQIQVEISNTREKLFQNQSELRLGLARLKRRLRLDDGDSLTIQTIVRIPNLHIDLQDAIQKGFRLNPSLRILTINRKRSEIDLENVKGWNAFRMNLEMTYGLEKEDEDYHRLWQDQDNSYSISLNAYIPIWDWGQRKARIQAQEISIRKIELWREERKRSIRTEITNAVENVNEYQARVQNMKKNVEMSKKISQMSIQQYKDGLISLQDLLQNVNRQKETELNFLDVYLAYRKSIIDLIGYTYYDYERNVPLLQHFNGES